MKESFCGLLLQNGCYLLVEQAKGGRVSCKYLSFLAVSIECSRGMDLVELIAPSKRECQKFTGSMEPGTPEVAGGQA